MLFSKNTESLINTEIMKMFLKYDYYLQTCLVIIMLCYSVIDVVVNHGQHFLAYYFVVGLAQLASYLFRIYCMNAKGKFIFIYGCFVNPVWFALLASQIDFPYDDIWAGFLWMGLFFCPMISFFYPFYVNETYSDLEKSHS